MATPKSKQARLFYRAARQRLDDAEFLLESERTTAAVYLAGYVVECVFKALIITEAGTANAQEVVASFRGSGAHNYDWLRSLYQKHGGPTLPKAITEAFLIVENWGTDLRYRPGTIPADEAEDFLDAVRRIWKWADRRL